MTGHKLANEVSKEKKKPHAQFKTVAYISWKVDGFPKFSTKKS